MPEVTTGDISVLARVRIESGGFGLISNFGANPFKGYWISASDEHRFLLGPVVNNDFFLDEIVEADVGQVAGLDKDVWMQVDAVGNELKAWYWHDGDPQPESPQLTFQLRDEQIVGSGFPALWSFLGESVVREFHVRPIPEPSSSILFVVGGGIFALAFRRSRKRFAR
jgi:hypothetical protein